MSVVQQGKGTHNYRCIGCGERIGSRHLDGCDVPNDEVRAGNNATRLCGDPTCQSDGCTQEAIDRWNARQDAAAHRAVVGALGFCWDKECDVCPKYVEAR